MPPDASAASQRFLVRQPLLDASCRVAGYEFGLRDRVPVPVLPGAESFEQARDEYLIASVVDLEHQRILGDRLTLLDLAPATLDNPMLAELPSGKVAVAIPLSSPELHASCTNLAAMGIRAVLDDDGAELPAAVPAAGLWARMDCRFHDAMSLGQRAEYFRRRGVHGLIAGNVDSEETFVVCSKLAFERFQGDFLNRPRVGADRKLSTSVIQIRSAASRWSTCIQSGASRTMLTTPKQHCRTIRPSSQRARRLAAAGVGVLPR